jgi:hypothetical protein
MEDTEREEEARKISFSRVRFVSKRMKRQELIKYRQLNMRGGKIGPMTVAKGPKDIQIGSATGAKMYILPGKSISLTEGKEWLSKMRNGEKFVPMDREEIATFLDGMKAREKEREDSGEQFASSLDGVNARKKRKREDPEEQEDQSGIGEIVTKDGVTKKVMRIVLRTGSVFETEREECMSKGLDWKKMDWKRLEYEDSSMAAESGTRQECDSGDSDDSDEEDDD